MYLIEPFEADFGILQLLCEPDERRDRAVELPDDVGQRHHHAQCHLSVHHSPGSDEGDDDVRGLVEEHGARLLHLSQRKPPDADFEQSHLNPFPLPSFLLLAVVQLYLLHGGHHLYQAALLPGSLCKTPDVQFPSIFHEHEHPAHIQRVPRQEDAQYDRIIISQYPSEDEEIDKREQRCDR